MIDFLIFYIGLFPTAILLGSLAGYSGLKLLNFLDS